MTLVAVVVTVIVGVDVLEVVRAVAKMAVAAIVKT